MGNRVLDTLRRVPPPVGTDEVVTAVGPVHERPVFREEDFEEPAYARRPPREGAIGGAVQPREDASPPVVAAAPPTLGVGEEGSRWTRACPICAGWYYMRSPLEADRVYAVQLTDSGNGLVVQGRGGRLARCLPVEWASCSQPPDTN